MVRNHRDLLLNWGQVHFRAANKGTTICHEKKKCTYRQHIDKCQNVGFSKFFKELVHEDLGMSASLQSISTRQNVLYSFSFFSHLEALQMLQFIAQSSSPFAVRVAFCFDLSLLPISFNPQFSQDYSGEGCNYPVFANIFLSKYFLHFSKKMSDSSNVPRRLLFLTRKLRVLNAL